MEVLSKLLCSFLIFSYFYFYTIIYFEIILDLPKVSNITASPHVLLPSLSLMVSLFITIAPFSNPTINNNTQLLTNLKVIFGYFWFFH